MGKKKKAVATEPIEVVSEEEINMAEVSLILAAREVIAIARKKNQPIDVTKIIQVHMVFDGTKELPHSKGWVHTHRMWEFFELPDLEIRGVSPLLLMTAAGRLLNKTAQYMVDYQGKREVKVGQTVQIGEVRFKVEEGKPLDSGDEESHYQHPVLRIEDDSRAYICTECEEGEEHEH